MSSRSTPTDTHRCVEGLPTDPLSDGERDAAYDVDDGRWEPDHEDFDTVAITNDRGSGIALVDGETAEHITNIAVSLAKLRNREIAQGGIALDPPIAARASVNLGDWR